MKLTYSIRLDFGTLPAREMLVDNSDSSVKAISVLRYQHSVIDESLPGSNVQLPDNYALQNPQDYIDALEGVLILV
jgi:L-ribulokinase